MCEDHDAQITRARAALARTDDLRARALEAAGTDCRMAVAETKPEHVVARATAYYEFLAGIPPLRAVQAESGVPVPE